MMEMDCIECHQPAIQCKECKRRLSPCDCKMDTLTIKSPRHERSHQTTFDTDILDADAEKEEMDKFSQSKSASSSSCHDASGDHQNDHFRLMQAQLAEVMKRISELTESVSKCTQSRQQNKGQEIASSNAIGSNQNGGSQVPVRPQVGQVEMASSSRNIVDLRRESGGGHRNAVCRRERDGGVNSVKHNSELLETLKEMKDEMKKLVRAERDHHSHQYSRRPPYYNDMVCVSR